MGTTFLKAIVICLLARRGSLEESMKSITLQESSRVIHTPKKTTIDPKHLSDSAEKPVRMSARLLEQAKPSYVSGYDEKGQPVYSLVRLVSRDIVARIEDEIAVQEKTCTIVQCF